MTTCEKAKSRLIAGYSWRTAFVFCFFGIISSLSSPLAAQGTSEFPPPVIPIRGTGIYQEMVGKAEAFLKKKKLLEFYREASKIRAFFYEKRRERHRKQTGDDLAVMEWMIYLLAKAPLLPDDEWVIPVMKNAPGPSPRFFR